MKAIITGAAGFIGCNMARRLLDKGWEVIGIDNLSRRGSKINLEWLNKGKGEWSFLSEDVRNDGNIIGVFKEHPDTDLILHSAAQVAVTTSIINPRLDFEVNALGTFNILEAMRRYCPNSFLIFPSTNKVYGSMESLAVTENNNRYSFADLAKGVSEKVSLDFYSPYGCSKGVADQYVHDYGRIYGLKTVVCRQSCIYGERQMGVEDQGWVAWFLIAALKRLPIKIYGDGKQVRDILWIDDLITLFCQLYEQREHVRGNIYNVGGGKQNSISLLELIDMIPEITGYSLTYEHANWRLGDQKIFITDISMLEREMGWKPRVGIAEGIRRLFDWLRANGQDIRTIMD